MGGKYEQKMNFIWSKLEDVAATEGVGPPKLCMFSILRSFLM